MLLFQQTLSLDAGIFSLFSDDPAKVLFFDIETTGFSANSSYVYLIGGIDCADGVPTLRQWFLDDIAEEKTLVKTFLEYASGFHQLVHYNGTTFDLPYLEKKCQRHCLPFLPGTLCSTDIYRQLSPLRSLFHLHDLKQKTLEQFLGRKRQDPFSGGDLIPVYTEYLAKARLEALRSRSEVSTAPSDFSETGLPQMTASPANALLSVLLLHNHEDLTGLCHIVALLPILKFLQGDFTVKTHLPAELDTITFFLSAKKPLLSTDTADTLSKNPLLTRELPYGTSLILQLLPDASGMQLTLPFYHTTLKYFFDNYKEYYYLPMEDQAIHKSVAEFVDPAFRKKATRDTCYQKKTGDFLFQPGTEHTPVFREHYKDKLSFFAPTEAFLQSEEELANYAKELLAWMLGK